MQTLAVVHFLDEKGKPNLDIFQDSVFPQIYFFNFDGFKKTFGGGIVVWVSLTRHADPEDVFAEHLYIVMRGILDAPIGVMDDPFRRTAICNGHLESLQA
jgi:hypothetical protein